MKGFFRSSGHRWVRYIITLYVCVWDIPAWEDRFLSEEGFLRGARVRSLRLGKEALKRPAHWEPASGRETVEWNVGWKGVGRWLVVVSFHKWTCSFSFKEVKGIVHQKRWSSIVTRGVTVEESNKSPMLALFLLSPPEVQLLKQKLIKMNKSLSINKYLLIT